MWSFSKYLIILYATSSCDDVRWINTCVMRWRKQGEWLGHCDVVLGYYQHSDHTLEGASSASRPWLNVGNWNLRKWDQREGERDYSILTKVQPFFFLWISFCSRMPSWVSYLVIMSLHVHIFFFSLHSNLTLNIWVQYKILSRKSFLTQNWRQISIVF